MTKAPRHHAGFALVAIVVIGIQFHQEYYSIERSSVRPSWLEQLKEILYSANPDADITSYTGRGVQLLLVSNKAMPTSKLLTYVQHQRDEWAADNEKITDEQLLHLNYLERVDKEESITAPIDDSNTLDQSEDDSTVLLEAHGPMKGISLPGLPFISAEQLVHLSFLEIEQRKRSI